MCFRCVLVSPHKLAEHIPARLGWQTCLQTVPGIQELESRICDRGIIIYQEREGDLKRRVLTQEHRPHSIGSLIPCEASREIFSARRESSGSTAETAVHVSTDGGTPSHTSWTSPQPSPQTNSKPSFPFFSSRRCDKHRRSGRHL
jgi:hypothetical protein